MILSKLFKLKISSLATLLAASVVLLGLGHPVLLFELPGGLPFGNLLVAVIFCLPPLMAIALSRAGTSVRYLSYASLVAGLAWLPISIGLAGNLNLNFQNDGESWVLFTSFVAVLAVTTLVWATIDFLRQRRPA